jgi:hypothetical protein
MSCHDDRHIRRRDLSKRLGEMFGVSRSHPAKRLVSQNTSWTANHDRRELRAA